MSRRRLVLAGGIFALLIWTALTTAQGPDPDAPIPEGSHFTIVDLKFRIEPLAGAIRALEVKETRMSDNTLRVRWGWRNTTGKKVHLFSSDGARDAMKEQTYLIDPVNKKKHFVVTDAQGKVVGTALGFLNLDADQAFSPWAKFPAPPPNVEKVTVVVAKTPPFENIPIAK